MPAWSFLTGNSNTLYVGIVLDGRATLITEDTMQPSNKRLELGFFGSIGIKYAGEDEIARTAVDRYKGTWSLSLLANYFSGEEALHNQFFKDYDRPIGSIQGIFRFTVSDTGASQYNIFISATQHLQDIVGLNRRFVLKIGLGSSN